MAIYMVQEYSIAFKSLHHTFLKGRDCIPDLPEAGADTTGMQACR